MSHSFSCLPLPVRIHVWGATGVCTVFQGKRTHFPALQPLHWQVMSSLQEWNIHVTQKYKDSRVAITFIYIKEKSNLYVKVTFLQKEKPQLYMYRHLQ